MIGKIISHYKIIEKLGAGGMGIVYKAQDTTLGRTVALKFLPPYATDNEEDRIRFVNEAQAAASLDHPNLCTIHEISEVDGHYFIAMAFVDGKGLREIAHEGPLPIDQAVDITLQIASGLAAAHAHGIIHRDIKPANVIVGTNGVVKIVDFGLAKSSISKKLTRTGSTIGTAAYMSPEQARGEPVDPRTDIWSVGAVLYELLTGQPPYSGPHEAMVIYAILNEDFAPAERLRPQIPLRLQQIINRALAKDVNKRYPNMGELITDLHALEGLVVTRPHKIPEAAAPPAAKSAKQPGPSRLKRYLLPAAGVVVVAAVGTWFVLRPAKNAATAPSSSTDTSRTPVASTDSARPGATPAAPAPAVAVDSIPPGVAILPFEVLQGAKDDATFAAGLTLDFISALSGLRSIRILPHQETMTYQGHQTASRTIGKALNADYVMQGTVRRDHNKLQMTTQLVKVGDGSTVWNQQFDRDLKDIFQVQGEIAKGMAGALAVEVSPAERKALARAPTSDADAYDYYLRGRVALERCTADDNEQAEKFFRKSTGSDKGYAPAQIGLAQTYLQRIENDFDPDPKWISQASPILDKAAAIDSTPAELHLGYSTLYRLRGAASKSVASARRAVALHPNDPEAHFALGLSLCGSAKSDEADREFVKTLELRPEYADPYLYRSRIAFFSGNAPAADSFMKRAVELAPHSVRVHVEAAQQLLRRGRFDEAANEAAGALQSMPKAATCVGLAGSVELWQRKTDNAIDHLKSAAEDLQSADLYRQLGSAYRLNGKKGPAEKAFRNSLRFDQERLAYDSTNVPVAYRVLLDQCLLDPGFAYETELSRLTKKSFRSIDPAERAYLTAMIHCAVGKNDRMLAALRDALKATTVAPGYVAADPFFATFSNDSKFRSLVGLK